MEGILHLEFVINGIKISRSSTIAYLLSVSLNIPKSKEYHTHSGSKILDIRHHLLFLLKSFRVDKTEWPHFAVSFKIKDSERGHTRWLLQC
jgi:hypothetical protein